MDESGPLSQPSPPPPLSYIFIVHLFLKNQKEWKYLIF